MATEKRLIAFDPITFESFTRHATKHREPDASPYDMGYTDAVEQIDDWLDANTVDAVPVVRCKDCRWARCQDHREPTDTPKQYLICQCFMNHHIPAPRGERLAVNPEHFCSYGERKDNAHK